MPAVADRPYALSMTPESSEGRERIARMEVQIDANRRQIEMLAALPLQVGVIQERLDSLRSDLHEAERERDHRLDRHEAKVDGALERLAESFSNQIATCSNRIAQMQEAQQKWQEADQKRRDDEREKRQAQEREEAKTAETSKAQRFVARYGLVTGLSVVLISSLTSIGIAIFGGS
jgi:septal ring factor EnvC (AmiA/AmiB activator)